MKLPLGITHMSQAPGYGDPVGPGAQAYYLEVGQLEVWFSYSTPIAFRVLGCPLVIRENEWNKTTGQHLNAIDPDHSKRISGPQFEAQLEDVLSTMHPRHPREMIIQD